MLHKDNWRNSFAREGYVTGRCNPTPFTPNPKPSRAIQISWPTHPDETLLHIIAMLHIEYLSNLKRRWVERLERSPLALALGSRHAIAYRAREEWRGKRLVMTPEEKRREHHRALALCEMYDAERGIEPGRSEENPAAPGPIGTRSRESEKRAVSSFDGSALSHRWSQDTLRETCSFKSGVERQSDATSCETYTSLPTHSLCTGTGDTSHTDRRQ